MKTTTLSTLFVAAMTATTISFAQDSGDTGPYAIFGRTHILGENNTPSEKIFVIRNTAENSSVDRIEHHTQSGIIKVFSKDEKLIGEKQLTDTENAWTTPDPMAEKYYSISPYAYCLNNPANAIDPDGRIVIFVNGMHFGEGGTSAYWSNMDNAVMKQLNDYKRLYYDGSMGGAEGLHNSVMTDKVFGPYNPKSINAEDRYNAGYTQGSKSVGYIAAQLEEGETVKFITHSMGAAYAKGMIQGLLENGFDPSLIAFEADFAPFQPTKQSAVQGVPTFQFTNKGDNIANNSLLGSPFGQIKGASLFSVDEDKSKGHSITNFGQAISSLPAGRYRIENGQFINY